MTIWILLLINVFLTLLFYFQVKDDKERVFCALFLILPIVGFLIYFMPKMFFGVTKKHNLYDVSNVKLKINEESFSKKPNVQEEMNIVAFNEVMDIGLKEEKRALLLNVIKDDLVDNAAFIRSAMGNTDSETSHYAASATMQIYTKLRASIQSLETQLQLELGHDSVMLELLSVIGEYILSGVLTKRDRDFYAQKYIKTFNQVMDEAPDILTSNHYLRMVDFQFLTSSVHESIKTAVLARDKFDNEETHLKLLELYYKTGNKAFFEEAYKQFLASNLTVSSAGLDLIRFWNMRAV